MVTGGSFSADSSAMTWVALGVLATIVGAWYQPVSVDEAWSLVVARRMNRGDRLYRDVFYGAAPLAIWLQSLAFRLLRPQGVVVRGLTVIYQVAQLWAAAALLGGDSPAVFAVVGVLVGIGGLHLGLHNHYGQLTAASALWGAVAVFHGLPVVAGLVLGLGLLGRYPAGVLATVALGLVVGWSGDWPGALGLLAASTVPVLVFVLVRPSSVRWFVERAVANKRAYLASGGFSPRQWVTTRTWSSWPVIAIHASTTVAMLGVVAAPAASAWSLYRGLPGSAIALALAAVGLLMVYPRFDGAHALAAIALSGPAVALAASSAEWLLWVGALGWLMAVLGLAGRVRLTRVGTYRRDLPSMRHLPVAPIRGGVWPDETLELPTEVFLLRIDAALVYACGGLVNPTPFDYPAVSTFGAGGQRLVLNRFQEGMPVCNGWGDPTGPLTPVELLEGLVGAEARQTRLGALLGDGRSQ